MGAWGQDVWDGTADVTWYKDSESSFKISTPEQLAGLAQLVNGDNTFEGKTITLANDIVLNEGVLNEKGEFDGDGSGLNTWTPIGGGTYAKLFKGSFDGQNHTISGIYIRNESNNQGLFGYVDGGKIQNLSVADSYIQALGCVGGIVGYNNNGTVSNCSNSGTVTWAGPYVGGIVGYNNNSTVSNCSNSGTVTGTDAVGGIVGNSSSGSSSEVSNCSNSGTVTGSYTVGGIVGSNGYNGVNCEVLNCSNSGTVTGEEAVGGVVGYNGGKNGTVSNCYYLAQEGLQGVGDDSGTSINVELKTPEEYTSGEVARLLDETGEIWGQDFGKGYPVPLGCLSEEEREAYKIYSVTFTYTLPDGGEDEKEKTITLYGNSDTPLTAPEETDVEGYAVTWTPALPETFGTENPTFTATFTKTYTLTITQPTEGGTISATVGETPVEDEVAEGATVTLEATPAAGYKFVEWDVKKSDGGESVTVTDNAFTMPGDDVTVTATFQAIDYTITISETTNGTVTVDKVTANMGEEVTLTVTPNVGYTLDALTVKVGETTITVTDNKFTMPAGDVVVTATFEKKPEPEPDPTPIYYNIQFEDICEGVDASLSKSVVKEGNQVSVYVEVEEGYDAENLKVMCKRSLYGYWEEVEEGVQPGEYIIYNVYTDIYVKVEGVEKIEIEEEPTGMSDIEGTKVYTQNGSLYVYTSQPQEVMIITMNGTILKRERQEGLRFYPLPKGVYIICIGEERYKVRN